MVLEIFKDQRDIFQGLFLFYFIISGNYLGELMACNLKQVLTENMYIKHIVGFFSLFLTLTLTVSKHRSLKEILLISIILYVWFLLTTRTNVYFTLLIMVLLFGSFMLQIYKDRVKTAYKKEKKSKKKTKKQEQLQKQHKEQLELIKKWEDISILVFLIVCVLGVFIYIYKQMNERQDFSFNTFIIGKPTCDWEK